MTPDTGVDRRRFIGSGLLGAALVGAGGVAGWAVSRLSGRERDLPMDPAGATSAEPVYDLSRFTAIDPALLRYAPVRDLDTQFKRVRCLAVAGDRTLVGGDLAIRVYDASGDLRQEIALPAPPHCLDTSHPSQIVVGLRDRIQIWGWGGGLVQDGPSLGEDVFLTAAGRIGDRLYLADAGNREIICADLEGQPLTHFAGGGPEDVTGFVVPSPYFDLAVAPDGRLHITNPGKHRVEVYTADGKLESFWGRPGMAIEGFCGCCNPVHLAFLGDGRYVTSEKGLDRIKIYGADGTFDGVVAGTDQFGGDPIAAAKAADDCRIGCGFDIAVNEQGEVLVLNARSKHLQVFAPIAKGGSHAS